MRQTWLFQRSSALPVPAAMVWARVVTPAGINHEMRPWMTMSVPRRAVDLTIDNVEVGVPVGRAWLRLFGVLPFDYDHLSIVELEPGRRFREESTMATMRLWVHDRTVEPSADGSGSVVTDRVELTPRWWIRWAGPMLQTVLEQFFRHRHRRLVTSFAADLPTTREQKR